MKQHIKEYERLDDFIKNEESKLKKYKTQKSKLQDKIVKYIQHNNLQEYNIQTRISNFEYIESNRASGFTQKHIKDSLKSYFLHHQSQLGEDKCKQIAEDIFKYISSSRKTNKKITLKRILNKNN